MSTLRDALNDAYKTAMKSHDEAGVRTLRLLNSELRRLEIDERRAATEAEVLQFIQKNIKKRRETIESAAAQNRADVVANETAELLVLERFLPQQIPEAELIAIVEATVRESGATTKKEMGRVMSALMPKIQGKADGKLVSKLVSERLA